MIQPIQIERRVARAALVPPAMSTQEHHAADQQREPGEQPAARDAEQHADGRAALRRCVSVAQPLTLGAAPAPTGTSTCR